MESTLSLTFAELAGDVGDYLGYGRGTNTPEDQAWTAKQTQDVMGCLKSGLRQFYFPKPLSGEATSYDWSFLKPTASLLLVQGAQDLLLPDDLGGLEGRVTIAGTSTSQTPWPLDQVPIGVINQNYALSPTATGRPRGFAMEWLKPTGPQSGQRAQLKIWPIADQDYTLQVVYYINPDMVTTGNPYPLGGLMHAETIREAVLKAAENFKDDASTIHAMLFEERLAASINADRKMKPQLLGYNGDRSDLRGRWNNRDTFHWLNWGGITYNGVQY